MTFELRKPDGPPERPSPVTPARIAAALATRGYVTQTMGGAVTGAWDGFDVEIRLHHAEEVRAGGPQDGAHAAAPGSLLVVEAQWGHAVPGGMRSAVHLALNDWNRQQLWPTGVLVPRDEGWTATARFVADVADGLGNEQLVTTLDTALRSSLALLKSLGVPSRRLTDE
ncbi:MAG TPA: YbjN domain-containing protein [Actinomycetaceae bacterium]|nr:YbjN domain-containing protein [Actinomycetaceae bacterium]